MNAFPNYKKENLTRRAYDVHIENDVGLAAHVYMCEKDSERTFMVLDNDGHYHRCRPIDVEGNDCIFNIIDVDTNEPLVSMTYKQYVAIIARMR